MSFHHHVQSPLQNPLQHQKQRASFGDENEFMFVCQWYLFLALGHRMAVFFSVKTLKLTF